MYWEGVDQVEEEVEGEESVDQSGEYEVCQPSVLLD